MPEGRRLLLVFAESSTAPGAQRRAVSSPSSTSGSSLFSAPLSIASGCVGLAQYAGYLFPPLRRVYFDYELPIPVPLAWQLSILAIRFGPATLFGDGVLFIRQPALLYRNIFAVSRPGSRTFSGMLIVMGTLLTIIVVGLSHFHSRSGFQLSPEAPFSLSGGFFTGLGAALLIATYALLGCLQHLFFSVEKYVIRVERFRDRSCGRSAWWPCSICY